MKNNTDTKTLTQESLNHKNPLIYVSSSLKNMKDITNSRIVTNSSNYKGSVRSFTQMFVYNMRRSLYVLNKVEEPRYTETKK